MSKDYPDSINPLKAAQGGRRFSGTLPLARLHRLHDVAADPERGEFAFQLSFCLDEYGNVRAELGVSGELILVCQRSLKTYAQPIESHSVLGIVTDERAAEALPEDYEPLLIQEWRLRIEDIIAEEILLSLPLVPRAPDSCPVSAGPAAAPKTYKPFAELAELAAKADTDPFKQE